jgi:hypothetical protein
LIYKYSNDSADPAKTNNKRLKVLVAGSNVPNSQ